MIRGSITCHPEPQKGIPSEVFQFAVFLNKGLVLKLGELFKLTT